MRQLEIEGVEFAKGTAVRMAGGCQRSENRRRLGNRFELWLADDAACDESKGSADD